MKFTAPLLLATLLGFTQAAHFVRRAASELTEEQNQWLSIIAASQPKLYGSVPAVIQPCTPCVRNGRALQLFPKLRKRWEDSSQAAANNDQVVELMQSSGTADIFGDATIGGLLGTIASNPVLLVGIIVIALAVILPLAILEGISQATATPILCILGFNNTLFFGRCDDRRLAQVDGSSLQKFFPDGLESIPTNVTDAESQVASVLEFGLSDDTIKYLNNATVASVVTAIANGEETRPLLGIALSAFLPIVTLQRVSTFTNTPIACLLGDCRRLTDEKRNGGGEQECELELMQCEMNNAWVMLRMGN
jgi:hypothetical protein